MPAKGRSLIHMDGPDPEFVDIGAFVMFRIRKRGLQHLLQRRCCLASAKRQNLDGSFHREAS